MAHLLWTELSLEWDSMLQQVYTRFRQLATEAGHTMAAIDVAKLMTLEPAERIELFPAILRNADAYLVSHGNVLSHEPYRDVVCEEVRNGKRLLASAGGAQLNGTLDAFDIQITGVRLYDLERPADHRARESQDQLAAIPMTPDLARDPLFEGVSEVIVGQPRVVEPSGRAEPLLAIRDRSDPVDVADLPILDETRRTCGAMWSPGSAETPQVIALGGGDFLTNGFAERNGTFTRNLLAWLAGEGSWHGDLVELASRYVRKIERSLLDILLPRLKARYGEDGWQGRMPETMRARAKETYARNGGRIPIEGCPTFTDLKRLMGAEWELVSDLLAPDGESKAKALNSWFERVADIRNRASHEAREVHEPIQASDVEFLKERLDELDGLWRTSQRTR